jgi:uncharacterized protein
VCGAGVGYGFRYGVILRAVALATNLRGHRFHLPDPALALLVTTCAGHTNGSTDGHITVQTCWDADRLDLRRVGIPPDPARLCTSAAREPHLFAWATRLHLLGEALDPARLTREAP